ncbi:MAG: tRNA (adenosine(37)-N6)-threonylcarbamoyltransferase complex dimerization subunit type 1 TsaB [Proteobacteria bacterium]|nr:tRNA (adenosine(37)-N6)-threonylcarbamoyltransferase complex dimerization subunit type 1 TsaB [Pseudomonadota bacterium]
MSSSRRQNRKSTFNSLMIISSMLVLALDTATLVGSIGWVCTTDSSSEASIEAFAECAAPARPGHAETLLPRMNEILAWGGYRVQDVDLVVFGRGPGTFTGLRIGLSTVKGLALALDVPAIGISSLEALAFSIRRDGLVATLIDARRSELFGALFEVAHPSGWPVATPIIEEWVGPSNEVIAELARRVESTDVFAVGGGIAPYRQDIIRGLGSSATILPEQSWAASAFWMARIGLKRFLERGPDDLDAIDPVYLREPDARLPGGG